MARVPAGGGFQVRRAAHPAGRDFHWAAAGAHTMGRAALIAARRPSPSAAGGGASAIPGRPPPPPPPLPPCDPAASRRGAAGGKAWWGGRGGDTRGRAGKTKGGCGRPKARKRGAGGGPGGRSLPLGAYCSPGAHPHALNKKLTHPAAAYRPIDGQTNSAAILHREGL
ncbi:Hypothetical predicted protein [Marmota monax]|uniref:Uncharacterized protein n=1 Tax=Marmota monax TaxID=9995 RepID=A0A5E4BKN5_MARMO|nr:hypothetical protein GHT09_003641 [Marmota monax]VTJ69955.1 Hypothetical predicted protein [Marmota monax]